MGYIIYNTKIFPKGENNNNKREAKLSGPALAKEVMDRKDRAKKAGEMAQWVKALTTLPKGLSSNPSNHMGAHSHL